MPNGDNIKSTAVIVGAAIVFVAAVAVLVTFAPRCKPGDAGVLIGGVILVAGCR
jgi:hypothetical protein